MSIATISTYLATKLKGIDGVDPAYVFEFENPSMPGYPCLGVTLKEWKGRAISNAQNERSYVFTIRIYQDMSKAALGPQAAEAALRNLADIITASFDSDISLGRNAVYALPVGGRLLWLQDQPIRVMEIDVECRTIANSSDNH